VMTGHSWVCPLKISVSQFSAGAVAWVAAAACWAFRSFYAFWSFHSSAYFLHCWCVSYAARRCDPESFHI